MSERERPLVLGCLELVPGTTREVMETCIWEYLARKRESMSEPAYREWLRELKNLLTEQNPLGP